MKQRLSIAGDIKVWFLILSIWICPINILKQNIYSIKIGIGHCWRDKDPIPNPLPQAGSTERLLKSGDLKSSTLSDLVLQLYLGYFICVQIQVSYKTVIFLEHLLKSLFPKIGFSTNLYLSVHHAHKNTLIRKEKLEFYQLKPQKYILQIKVLDGNAIEKHNLL